MLNFSFIPQTAFEKKILNIFSKIYPLCCYSNQTNKVIFTKVALNVKDYSINIYVKTKFKYPQPDNGKSQFPLFSIQVNGNFKLP